MQAAFPNKWSKISPSFYQSQLTCFLGFGESRQLQYLKIFELHLKTRHPYLFIFHNRALFRGLSGYIKYWIKWFWSVHWEHSKTSFLFQKINANTSAFLVRVWCSYSLTLKRNNRFWKRHSLSRRTSLRSALSHSHMSGRKSAAGVTLTKNPPPSSTLERLGACPPKQRGRPWIKSILFAFHVYYRHEIIFLKRLSPAPCQEVCRVDILSTAHTLWWVHAFVHLGALSLKKKLILKICFYCFL